MVKALLKTLIILTCFVSGVSQTYAQNPVITSPANNATVATTGFQVSVTPSPLASFTVVQVTDLSTNMLYSQSSNYNGTTPFTYNVPSGLKATTQYRIRAASYDANYRVYATEITVTTSSTPPPSFNPVITSPVNTATVSTGGFPVSVTPSPLASFTIVQILEASTGALYSQSTNYSGTSSFTYSVPSGLKVSTQYIVRAISYDASFKTYTAEIRVTTSSTPPPSFNPVITSPVNTATVSTGGFPVSVTPSPATSFTIVQILEASTSALYSQSPRYPSASPFTYSVPAGLKAGFNYIVRAISYTSAFQPFSSQVTVLAIGPAPVVTAPVAPNLTNLNPCGFTVSVNPYANANAMRVYWKDPSQTTFPSANFVEGIGSGPYNILINTLQALSSYDLRVVAGIKSGTTFTVISQPRDFSITTGNIPALTITSPADGSIGISINPTIQIGAYTGCGSLTSITIALFETANPSGTQQTVISNITSNGPFTVSFPTTLAPLTNYTIRVVNAVNYNGKTTTATSTSAFTTENRLGLTYMTNTVGAVNSYFNSFNQTIEVLGVLYADQYDIQIDNDLAFGSPEILATISAPSSPNPTYSFTATQNGLVSGGLYYVRAKARKTTGTPAEGPWTNEVRPDLVRSFYNSLHPIALTSPTGNWGATNFKIKTLEIPNATDYIFQMAIADNDTDPNNDFDPAKIVSNPASYGGNDTHPDVAGNVFKANGRQVNTLSVERIFNYIAFAPAKTTFRVRVRAARKDASGNYVQLGYWSAVSSFTTNAVPNRFHPVVYPANNAMNVDPKSVTIIAADDVNYLETSYELQVSESPTFATIAFQQTGGRSAVFTGLKYGTAYYTRARSTVNIFHPGQPNPSVWNTYPGAGVIKFTTSPAPTGRVNVAAAANGEEVSEQVTSFAYPNPFDRGVAIQVSSAYSKAKVKIYAASGSLVEEYQSSAGAILSVGEAWKSGVYILQITGEKGNQETIRLVKH